MLAAFGAMLLPESVMAAIHERLGLGIFPASPLVDYLTRSISGLYGIHGCLYLLVASDVVRYRPLIALFATVNVVFGAVMIAIDLHAGMPWFWTLAEGPSIVIVGLVWFVLLGAVPRRD